jgi:hypothetical protein
VGAREATTFTTSFQATENLLGYLEACLTVFETVGTAIDSFGDCENIICLSSDTETRSSLPVVTGTKGSVRWLFKKLRMIHTIDVEGCRSLDVVGTASDLQETTAHVALTITSHGVPEVLTSLIANLSRRRSPEFFGINKATGFVAYLRQPVSHFQRFRNVIEG